jgi:hypothetical protein
MERQSKSEASAVLMDVAKQGADTTRHEWSLWVEASIWTERMLAALGNGVKGGKWWAILGKHERRAGFGKCYSDHSNWPNSFFAKQGLFTMKEAHAMASRSRC